MSWSDEIDSVIDGDLTAGARLRDPGGRCGRHCGRAVSACATAPRARSASPRRSDSGRSSSGSSATRRSRSPTTRASTASPTATLRARAGRGRVRHRAGPRLPRERPRAAGRAVHGPAEARRVLGPLAPGLLRRPRPGHGGGGEGPDMRGRVGEPVGKPPSQSPPKNGTGPRVKPQSPDLPHRLIGWVGADGFPEVVPFDGRVTGRARSRSSRPPACPTASAAPACSRTTTTRSSSASRRASTPAGSSSNGSRGALRAAHGVEVQGPCEQDPAAARERIHCPSGAEEGTARRRRHRLRRSTPTRTRGSAPARSRRTSAGRRTRSSRRTRRRRRGRPTAPAPTSRRGPAAIATFSAGVSAALTSADDAEARLAEDDLDQEAAERADRAGDADHRRGPALELDRASPSGRRPSRRPRCGRARRRSTGSSGRSSRCPCRPAGRSP